MSDEPHTPKSKRLEDILGARSKTNQLDELLSGASGKKPAPMEVLRTNFADLPPIPDIGLVEQRNLLALEGALSNDLYKVMAGWMIIDETHLGKSVSPEAVLLEEQLATGTKTTLTFPDAWELGIALIKPLQDAYKANDRLAFEQGLSALYWRCKFNETWEGEEGKDKYESFAETVENLLKEITVQDVALAKKLIQQKLSEAECNTLRRIVTAVTAGKEPSANDMSSIEMLTFHLQSYHSFDDSSRKVLPEIFKKIYNHISLADTEKTQLKEIADTVLANPPLSAAERSILGKRPQIELFVDFVRQTGFMRFGDLMMASNDLSGFMDKEMQWVEGALQLHTQYANSWMKARTEYTYTELAELHRQAMAQTEKGLKHLEGVKELFGKENLITHVPRFDPAVMIAMQEQGRKLAQDAGKTFQVEKIYDRNIKKLSSTSLAALPDSATFEEFPPGRKATVILKQLKDMKERIEYRLSKFEKTFGEDVKALSEAMRSGASYDALSVHHKDLMLAIPPLQSSFQMDVDAIRTRILPDLEKEMTSAKAQKEYKIILSEIAKRWREMLAPEEDFVKAIAGVQKMLTEGMDHLEFGAVAADRMTEYAGTILQHMQERQKILDQYAAAETKTASAISDSAAEGKKR